MVECVCGLYCFVTEYFMFPFRLEFFNNVGVTSSSCTFITSQENLKDFLILPPSLPNINGYKNANALNMLKTVLKMKNNVDVLPFSNYCHKEKLPAITD